eukprot:TRINITY_DN11973_c2_g7_i1.p2 TRINITY_DN11973_c2_g7~~TRINITY_DN11973_c2_g7_i1.p2  ORF type:complete len:299 (-),score=26.56 TRINITY_DN11973_c2_g7_i1:7-903(-)
MSSSSTIEQPQQIQLDQQLEKYLLFQETSPIKWTLAELASFLLKCGEQRDYSQKVRSVEVYLQKLRKDNVEVQSLQTVCESPIFMVTDSQRIKLNVQHIIDKVHRMEEEILKKVDTKFKLGAPMTAVQNSMCRSLLASPAYKMPLAELNAIVQQQIQNSGLQMNTKDLIRFSDDCILVEEADDESWIVRLETEVLLATSTGEWKEEEDEGANNPSRLVRRTYKTQSKQHRNQQQTQDSYFEQLLDNVNSQSQAQNSSSRQLDRRNFQQLNSSSNMQFNCIYFYNCISMLVCMKAGNFN